MFDSYALLAITPIVGLAVYFIVHVPACWVLRGASYFIPIIVGLLAGLLATIAMSLATSWHMQLSLGDTWAILAMNLIAFLGLGYGYFNFVNINLASLRIRMMDEVLKAGGRMSRAELLSRYNTDQVINLRIDRLTRWGNLIERQGRYYSGKAWFLRVAEIFDFLRWIVFGSGRSRGPRNGRG